MTRRATPPPVLCLAIAAVLAGCAAGPGRRAPMPDGPGASPPHDLERVPDALPRVEPLRNGGPNKPYEVFGRWYQPLAADLAWRESGLASWYGVAFHGRPTASGEPYDMYAMTAAHKTLPIPSYARVRNPANGREVVVRVNDRGPFVDGRIVDLSYTAALRLGVLNGVAPVELVRITHDEIRTGLAPAGGQGAPAPQAAADAPAASDARRAAPGDDVDPLGRMLADRGLVPREPAAGGVWLQLGVFAQRDGALQMRERLRRDAPWLAALLALFDERGVTRLQAGPYVSRIDAELAAERLRGVLGAPPLLLERR